MMERLIEDYFEVEMGEKEEERLSHTHSVKQSRRERGGQEPVRESATSVREKAKVFHSCTETDCFI